LPSGRVLVAGEGEEFLLRLQIPDLDLLVVAAGSELAAVGVERDRRDRVGVASERVEQLPVRRREEFDRLVGPADGDELAARRVGDGQGVVVLLDEGRFRVELRLLGELRRLVLAAQNRCEEESDRRQEETHSRSRF
jgi:hypothetical protein